MSSTSSTAQLLGILAKPIQDSLHITDGQLGLIGGFYFALLLLLHRDPGRLVRRPDQPGDGVLSLACAIWSAATIACGLAATYPQLVAARMTVGFGEAGGVPPSYAIITDTFPPGRRGMALGIYNLGPPIGAALGHRVRRLDRRGLRLARRLHRDRRDRRVRGGRGAACSCASRRAARFDVAA